MEWLSGIVTLGVQGATCLPAAKMSVGCVLVLGGRLSPPSSCGLANPDFCPPAGPAEFFGSKNAAIARQTRQPGSRPATRITPLCGVSAPKNHIDPCTPRVRIQKTFYGTFFCCFFCAARESISPSACASCRCASSGKAGSGYSAGSAGENRPTAWG